MAISPSDFYQQAVILQRKAIGTGGDCADLRSCISRAYYGAFLTARDAKNLSSVGHSGHKEVLSAYKASSDPKDTIIHNSLRDLKELRKMADYDVHRNCTAKNGNDAMAYAGKVIRLLNANPAPAANTTAP